MEQIRKCIVCGSEKSTKSFDKNKKTCNKCEYKRAIELHKLKILNNETKVCTVCGKSLHIKEFGVKRGECKKCKAIQTKEYYKNHTEQEKKYAKKYHAEHKQRHHETWAQWKASDPYKYWAYNTRSQHKIKGNVINITTHELAKIARNSNICAICNHELDWRPNKKMHTKYSPTLDRVHNGNIINVNNIMIICHSCNATKQDRTFEEFIEYCKYVVNKFTM